jgi:hypothetical protein
MTQELVPGRECGECRACCVDLIIDTKELQKLPGVRCPHLCGNGCAIYETRYPVCREYYCGWRQLDLLGDEWRPDRSRVLFDAIPEDDLPEHRRGRPNLRFALIGEPPVETMRALYDMIARLIAGDVWVILAVRGPIGHYPAQAVLNEALQDRVANGDLSLIEAALSDAVALATKASHCFHPVEFKNGGDSGSQ